MTVSGVVDSVPGRLSPFYMRLRGLDDRSQSFFSYITFYFSPEEADKLNELVWGQSVKIRGQVDQTIPGIGLRFSGSKLVEVGKLPEAVATFTAEQLWTEYVADKKGIIRKYSGKVVDVSGLVTERFYSEQYYLNGETRLTLHWLLPNSTKPKGAFRCTIRGRDARRAVDLTYNQKVTIRGRLFVNEEIYPTIDQGHLVESGNDGSILITAVELTKEFTENKEAALKKYLDKPLQVEGVVAMIKKSGDGGSGSGYFVEIAGFDGGKVPSHRIGGFVPCGGSKQREERLAALKVGQTIQLQGRGRLSLVEDQLYVGWTSVIARKVENAP